MRVNALAQMSEIGRTSPNKLRARGGAVERLLASCAAQRYDGHRPQPDVFVALTLFSHDDGTLAGETSEMKWRAFAEVLTLLSVAASILYLGYEVRQASLTISADLNREIYEAVDGLLDIQMQSAELRSAILQARQSYDSLTPDQIHLH